MKKQINLCHAGDIVIHKGKRMEVAQVVCAGREDTPRKKGGIIVGCKSQISAHPIYGEQVLRRNYRYIGEDWEHTGENNKTTGWTKKWSCCVICGTTERKHHGRGMCRPCYRRLSK